MNRRFQESISDREAIAQEFEDTGLNVEEMLSEKNKIPKEELDTIIKEVKDIVQNIGSLQEDEIIDSMKKFSQNEKNQVFEYLIKEEPHYCFSILKYFDYLPNKYQSTISRLMNQDNNYRQIANYDEEAISILSVFNKITDKKLSHLLASGKVSFNILAEKKEKLPEVSEDRLLSIANTYKDTKKEVYKWKEILPYIDKFESINHHEVISEIINSPHRDIHFLIIKHIDKLNIPQPEIINLFSDHDELDILMNNINYLKPDYHQEIVNKLIENDSLQPIIENVSKIKQVDINELLQKIIVKVNELELKGQKNNKLTKLLSKNPYWVQEMPQGLLEEMMKKHPIEILKVFDVVSDRIDRTGLIDILIKNGKYNELLINSDKLELELNEKLAQAILKANKARVLINWLDKFGDLSSDTYRSVFFLNPEETFKVIKNKGVLDRSDFQRLLDSNRFINNTNLLEECLRSSDAFSGLELDQNVADYFLNISDLSSYVIAYLEYFEAINYEEVINKSLLNGNKYELIENIEKIPTEFHIKIINEVLKDTKKTDHSTIDTIIEKINTIHGLKDDRELGSRLFDFYCNDSNWNTYNMHTINSMYDPPLSETFSMTYDDMSDVLNYKIFQIYAGILEKNEIPDEAIELGVKKSGKTGINELNRAVRERQKQFLEGKLLHKDILNPIIFQKLKKFVRYESSEWGQHDEDSLSRIISYYFNNREDFEPLNQNFLSSGKIQVEKIDKDSQLNFKHTETFLSRYGTLLDSISSAQRRLNKSSEKDKNNKESGFSYYLEKLSLVKLEVVKRLDKKIISIKDDQEFDTVEKKQRALANIEYQKKRLESLSTDNISGPIELYNILMNYKEFQPLLRELIFYSSFLANKDKDIPDFNSFSTKQPSTEEISKTLNFIDHITNRETFRQFFKNKKDRKRFESMLNTKELQIELSRMQKVATKGTLELEFIPSRDLLTELSGHTGDACWANKYISILEKFPNFTSITMVQNPESEKHRRIVGSCMLIETRAKDGTKLLVIRGLNPIENMINSVDISNFYDEFTSYLEKIASKLNRNLAIVIDDHSGGSSTNRPALFDFLEKKKKSLEKIRLKSDRDTKFNNYKITNNTYLV